MIKICCRCNEQFDVENTRTRVCIKCKMPKLQKRNCYPSRDNEKLKRYDYKGKLKKEKK
jgi:hypothetical protein